MRVLLVLATDDSTVLIHDGTFGGGPLAVASGSSTVTMLDGSFVHTNAAYGFQALESGKINIMGGTVDVDDGVGVYATGLSEVNLSGGTVWGNDGTGFRFTGSSRGNVAGGLVRGDTGISVKDQAIVTVSDGTVTSTEGTGLRLVGSAQGNILGGLIQRGEDAGIWIADHGIVSISDGTITVREGAGIHVEDYGVAHVYGGRIGAGEDEEPAIHAAGNGIVNIYGGQLLDTDGPALMISDAAVANIFGSDLAVSGTSVSGALADGTEFILEFETRGNGQVVLHEIPEPLLAGDADQDLDFDQFDLIRVQQAGKYLAGQMATWGEGDWNGAPGGTPGNPPVGDGVFDQLDIVAALQAGVYLTGPYAGMQGSDSLNGSLAEPALVHVPEPSAAAILVCGLCLSFACYGRRQHRISRQGAATPHHLGHRPTGPHLAN